MTRRSSPNLWPLLLLLLLPACGGGDNSEAGVPEGGDPSSGDPAASAAGAEVASVRILQPTEGALVEGPDLTVVLEISGMEIRPAGDMTPNSGHHHLFLDHDLPDPTQSIPAIPGQVIHMGDGSSQFVFQGVTPGQHRLIAVVGDHAHVPLQPWVVDTVTFTIR